MAEEGRTSLRDRARPMLARLRGSLRGRAAGRLILAASVAFAGWGGWSYWQAGQDEAIDFGKTRDEVLTAGRQAVADLNTMDATQVDQSLRTWLDASTGPLHEQLTRSRDRNRQQVQQSKASARGTVTDAAVIALDPRAGTAQMIAMVRVEITPQSGGASTDRKRFEAGLTRTPDGWKLRSLTAIPVNTT
jgi:Mce-associated membrane protein